MVQIGNVIVSLDLFRENFCCDLENCCGACCIEGDAGAPLSADEIAELEELLPFMEERLAPAALSVIREQGVAYVDCTGELVTSIVNGKDCVFALHDEKGICRCAIEELYFEGKTRFRKPVSCHLYPLRLGTVGDCISVSYHRWNVCRAALIRGKSEKMPLYRFLKEPLIRRFGEVWYQEMELVASELEKLHYLSENGMGE